MCRTTVTTVAFLKGVRMSNEQKPKTPSVKQVVSSVIAGAIGVQSEENRARDFNSSTIWPFVIGGVVFTLLFVGILMLVVNAVS